MKDAIRSRKVELKRFTHGVTEAWKRNLWGPSSKTGVLGFRSTKRNTIVSLRIREHDVLMPRGWIPMCFVLLALLPTVNSVPQQGMEGVLLLCSCQKMLITNRENIRIHSALVHSPIHLGSIEATGARCSHIVSHQHRYFRFKTKHV